MNLRVFVLLLVSATLTAGCTRAQSGRSASNEATANNAELARLFEQDQAARKNMSVDSLEAAAIQKLIREDSLRRVRVGELLGSGSAQTADDYYHAAMVFQHGADTAAYRRAHELAEKAVALDSTHRSAKWLTAASWDRYLMQQGKPQWYGTQFTWQAGEEWALYEVDTTKVTDDERRRLGVPSLEASRHRADSLNASSNE